MKLKLFSYVKHSPYVQYRKHSTTAISFEEFVKELAKIDGVVKTQENVGRDIKIGIIGLAISGGVDSMALAALCSLWKYNENCGHPCPKITENFTVPKFQAFVVDHRIRNGSKDEAQVVSKELINRGIPTEILTVKWHVEKPSCLSNIETLARQQRFRLLGGSCATHGIDSLILAHHEDDQVETILARLIAGHRGLGLCGIKSHATIPECFGMYGVHESGGSRNKSSLQEQVIPSKITDKLSSCSNQLVIESGGIRIYRPLLAFSKSRLISTCQALQMPWFEDETNQDPKITMRNAIRYLYRHHQLPAAITKPALISLSAKINQEVKKKQETILQYLSKIQICSFNTRTGTIKIRFPHLRRTAKHLIELSDTEILQVAEMILHKIVYLVSPNKQIDLSSLRGAIYRLFPELFQQKRPATKITRDNQIAQAAFTVAGTIFQPVESNKNPTTLNSNMKTGLSLCELKPIWLVSRQPPSLVKDSNYNLIVSTVKSSSSWTLIDGRFWMLVENFCSSLDLIVRLLRPNDLKPLSNQLDPATRKLLNHRLALHTPGKIRWTLPAIFCREVGTLTQIPLSLPTLNIEVPEASLYGKWEVRYKKVNIDGLNMTWSEL
ncbi:PP-loop family protein [Blumeria hordei DH14]|uniref:tRNA(Ile)-lysidine synthetase n=1 Tax=Blumeria graminis f. sp. hordei (strain DH14) TaxID=546991 RepID=N1JNI5_BLUG1|nr:PP-loop family protein [Blumeria hordei DH14]